MNQHERDYLISESAQLLQKRGWQQLSMLLVPSTNDMIATLPTILWLEWVLGLPIFKIKEGGDTHDE